MAEVRWIQNLKGTLYHRDTALLDFEIKDRQLIKAVDLNNKKMFPEELAVYGITYGNINAFFDRRSLQEGCMFYHEYLESIGMKKFNFDQYIMIHNGNNNLDNYWVKFDGFGAQSFEEICKHGCVTSTNLCAL